MSEPRFQRQLGVWDAIAITLGIVVGAGIFALPGRIAQYTTGFVESATLWAVGGVFSLLGVFLYAGLAARMPDTGGEYLYLRGSFGHFTAFLYGWSQLIVIRTAPAASQALVFAEYLDRLVPLSRGAQLLVAAALIWGLGVINYFGLRTGRPVQAFTTAAKMSGILIIIVAGFTLAPGSESHLMTTHVPASPDRLQNFIGAMLLVVFTYVGWDRLGNVAGEMKRPEQDIPRVLIGSVLLVIGLYVALAFVVYSAIPAGELARSATPASDTARILLGRHGETILALIVLTATSSNINASMLSCSRVYYTMSKDGFLPGLLDRVHPRYASPYVAVAAHVVWATCLLAAYRAIEPLIGSQVFALTIWYGVMAVAYLRLRCPRPWIAYTFIAGALLLAGATAWARPQAALANGALVAAGLPVFWWTQRRRSSA